MDHIDVVPLNCKGQETLPVVVSGAALHKPNIIDTPPAALAWFVDQNRWCAWDGIDKIPYQGVDRLAKSNDSRTWLTFANAHSLAHQLAAEGDHNGIGFWLGAIEGHDCGILGIDLDTCRDDEGRFTEWAQRIIDRFPTYIEISPSGAGAKLFLSYPLSQLDAITEALGGHHQWREPGWPKGSHGPAIEYYAKTRYFTVTGQRLPSSPDTLAVFDTAAAEWLITEGIPAEWRHKTAYRGGLGGGGVDSVEGRYEPDRDSLSGNDLTAWLAEIAGVHSGLQAMWAFGDFTDQLKGGDTSGSACAFALGGCLRKLGSTRAEMKETLLTHVVVGQWLQEKYESDPGGIERQLDRIWERNDGPVFGPISEDGIVGGETGEAPDLPTSWRDMLLRTEKGGIKPILTNAVLFLRYADEWTGRLGYDLFANCPMLLGAPPWYEAAEPFTSREIEDDDFSCAAIWLQQQGVGVGLEVATQAVITTCHRSGFHPVRAYLDGLEWDGTGRLDTVLIDHLGAEDTPLSRAISSKTLIAAVARVHEPGCQVKTVAVLEGEQNIGKSKFCEKLVPVRDWYTDTTPEIGSKDGMQQMRGVWIQEHAEMATLSRADAAKAKAFISSGVDRYRPSYGRMTRVYPRQCIFIATINPGADGYLRDETGASRFWPVKCGAGWVMGQTVDAARLVEVRDQLWAEAVHRYKAGEAWWLADTGLQQAQNEVTAERFADEAWGERVRDYLRSHPFVVSIEEIRENALHIGIDRWTNREMQSVGRTLRAVGWVPVQLRIDGERKRYYLPGETHETLRKAREHLESIAHRTGQQPPATGPFTVIHGGLT